MTGFATPDDDFFERFPELRELDADVEERDLAWLAGLVETGSRRHLNNDEILRLFQMDFLPGQAFMLTPDGDGDFYAVKFAYLRQHRDPAVEDA